MLISVLPSFLFHPHGALGQVRRMTCLSRHSAGSAEEQVAVLLRLCPHVLTRDQLAEIYCQACASGAFLSMPSSLHGFRRLRPDCWPEQPGRTLLAVNLLLPCTVTAHSVQIPAESPFLSAFAHAGRQSRCGLALLKQK